MDGQLVSGRELDQWRASIESAWQKSVESVIEVGRLVKHAKDELGSSYALLETQLPFSSTVAAFLVKIAEHPVLSDSQYYSKLPNGYNTLYYLASVDEKTLRKQIDEGEITPNFTIANAKKLRDVAKKGKGETNDKPQVENTSMSVGVILIAEPKNVAQFQDDLAKLLKRYDGTLKPSKTKDSLADWHNESLKKRALEEIETRESELEGVSVDQMRLLEGAAHYLSRPSNQSYKVEMVINDKTVERTALPPDYPQYKEIVKLTGIEPITRGRLKTWCIDNRIPNQFTELKSMDKSLYVWEQVRLITERKDVVGAKKRLKDLAARSPIEEIKELAANAYTEVTRFD